MCKAVSQCVPEAQQVQAAQALMTPLLQALQAALSAVPPTANACSLSFDYPLLNPLVDRCARGRPHPLLGPGPGTVGARAVCRWCPISQ